MDSWLLEFREIAKRLHDEGKLGMFSSSNKHAAYKQVDDEKVHVRYICPCGHKEEIYAILKSPYQVKCSACKALVWKSKLRKKRGPKAKA